MPCDSRRDALRLAPFSRLLFLSGRPRSSALRANWLPNTFGTNFRNRTSFPHQSQLRNPDEEPMLNHARHFVQGASQRRRICNPAKAAIQNVMALVGNECRSVSASPQLATSAKRRNFLREYSRCERDDLYGKRKLTESRNELGGVSHHDHPLRGRSDDLLAQQRAAAAFDQPQLRIDFIGAVDGDVDLRMFIERRERDAYRARK